MAPVLQLVELAAVRGDHEQHDDERHVEDQRPVWPTGAWVQLWVGSANLITDRAGAESTIREVAIDAVYDWLNITFADVSHF